MKKALYAGLLALFGFSLSLCAAPVAEGFPYTLQTGAETDFVALDPAENALYNQTPTVTGNYNSPHEGTSPSPSVLTDGVIPQSADLSVPHLARYTMWNNTSLEWEFEEAKSLSEVRIYSLWGDENRNCIVVRSIETKSESGIWTMIPNSAFGYSQTAAHNTIGAPIQTKRRCVRFFDNEGSPIALDAHGLRINFGHQDHDYGGFVEIEARLSAPWTMEACGFEISREIDYEQVGDKVLFSFENATVFRPISESFSATLILKNAQGAVVSSSPMGKFIPGISYMAEVPEGMTAQLECVPWDDAYLFGATVGACTGAGVSVATNDLFAVYTFTDTAALSSITLDAAGYVDVLVVGGGGAGGNTMAGGGGAGGVQYRESIFLQADTYEIGVGAGGATAAGEGSPGASGGESWFAAVLRSFGGGGGASWSSNNGAIGASGGGSNCKSTFRAIGIEGQGHAGGAAYGNRAGGGGGAGAPGEDGHADGEVAGSGGDGVLCTITGEPVYYGGGGGAGCGWAYWGHATLNTRIPGKGGLGGGGDGGPFSDASTRGADGVDGLGGGGGGGSYGNNGGVGTPGGRGGSGVVIVRTLICDTADSTPDATAQPAKALSETSAEFTYRIYSFGAPSTAADVVLRYGTTPHQLQQEAVLADGLDRLGEQVVTLDCFSPGTTYYAQIVVQGNAEGAAAYALPVSSFTTASEPATFVEPGLWQVRFDGTMLQWDLPVLSVAEGTADTQRQRTLGTRMAYTRDTAVNDFDSSVINRWVDNCTWAYSGYAWFTVGSYRFQSSMDDTAYVAIDGTIVHRVDTYTANKESTWTCLETGWHAIDIRVGNGTGNAGPISGSSLDSGLRFQGGNSTEWRTFVDPGDASFLRASDARALLLGACSRTETSLRATLSIHSSAIGLPLDFCYSDTYSTDETDWTILPLGTVSADALSRQDVIDIPASARFFRYRTVSGDTIQRSQTRSLSDIPVSALGNPAISFDSIVSTSATTATVAISILTTGEGCDSCDLILSYGMSPESLTRECVYTNFTEGTATLTLDGLAPGHLYYATVTALNTNDATSSPTTIFSFQTTTLTQNAVSALPGLWQARIDGFYTEWNADIFAIPTGTGPTDRRRTLGTHMAYTSGGHANDFDPTVIDDWTYTCTWLYTGAIYLEAGEIRFRSDFDDAAYIRIGTTEVHNPGVWAPGARTSWTCPATGWYPITLGLGNQASIAGPMTGTLAQYAFNFSTDGGTTWRQFIDPGDGSLLRTSLPFRDLSVTSYEFGDTSFSASLVFGENAETTESLIIAWGATCGGDLPSSWEHTATVTTIPPTQNSYDCNLDLAAANFNFVRFFFATPQGAAGSETLYRVPNTVPVLDAPLALDAHAGDTLAVAGTLRTAGAADTATVTLEVSTSPSMTNPVIWPIGDLESGESFALDLHVSDPTDPRYFIPGTTYYVRARATAADDFDLTPTVELAFPGAPAYDATSATATLGDAVFTLDLTALGAGDGTTITLLTGDSAETLAPTASAVVYDTGTVALPVSFPSLERTVAYAFRIDAACDTASWSLLTPTQTVRLTDTAKYTWRGEVQEGSWTDPACWIADPADPRCLYPNGTSTSACFTNCTSGEPYVIHVPTDVSISFLRVNAPEADITFRGVGRETSRIYADMYDTLCYQPGVGATTTYDNIAFETRGGFFTADDYTLCLTNAASFATGREIWHCGTDSLVAAYGDSIVDIRGFSFRFYGLRSRVLLDDSTLIVRTDAINLAYEGGATDNIIEFYGDHPQLSSRNVLVGLADSATAENTTAPIFRFYVPQNGYAQAPIVYNGNDNLFLASRKQKLRIEIDKKSPVFQTATTQAVPLIAWSPSGILTDYVDLENQPRPEDTTLFWAYGPDNKDPTATTPPSETANPVSLWASLRGGAFTVIKFR